MFLRYCVVLSLIFCLTLTGGAAAAKNTKYASIVIDAKTGMVLSQRYADKRLHPASLTKMMTLYMVFDALKTGKLRKGQRLWVSPHAASMQPSKLGLKPRSSIKVEHAILALATKSANDVAVVLGEAIGGSETGFARLMTKRARQLGMRNTTFKNASGLHNKRQVSTARDMARLSQALIINHPEYYHYFSVKQFKYQGKTYKTHNRLMLTYSGMDGIKTGYVRASGFNLAASVVRDGRRLIGVVFGGRSSKTRNKHMASLMNRGFVKAQQVRLAKFESKPPYPVRKPSMAYNIAALDATMNPNADIPDFNMMGLITGEGDADIEVREALWASLKNMAKTNAGMSQIKRPMKKMASASEMGAWSIQIGAFSDKKSGYKILKDAGQKLPNSIVASSERHLVPLKTQQGTVYRARFVGLNQKSAEKACGLLKNCIVLASN